MAGWLPCAWAVAAALASALSAGVACLAPPRRATARSTPTHLLSSPNLRPSQTAQSEVLILRPSATILWPRCAHPPDNLPPEQRQECVQESRAAGGATTLLVPPSLNDTHLLPLLKPYMKVGWGGGRVRV